MNKVRVTCWPPGGTVMETFFTSEKDSLHLRISLGVVEVKDGNIVLAVYANMPIRASNMDDDTDDDDGGA